MLLEPCLHPGTPSLFPSMLPSLPLFHFEPCNANHLHNHHRQFVSITSTTSSYCDRILNITPSPSPSASSSSSEDDDLPRAEPSAPTEGGGAVPAAEAASPSPELEILYSKPPEEVDKKVMVSGVSQPTLALGWQTSDHHAGQD